MEPLTERRLRALRRDIYRLQDQAKDLRREYSSVVSKLPLNEQMDFLEKIRAEGDHRGI